jgi:hypothetical protein
LEPVLKLEAFKNQNWRQVPYSIYMWNQKLNQKQEFRKELENMSRIAG